MIRRLLAYTGVTNEQLRKPLLLFCIIQVCFRKAFAACILAFAEGVVLCGAFAAAFAVIRFQLGNSIGILYNKVIDLYKLFPIYVSLGWSKLNKFLSGNILAQGVVAAPFKYYCCHQKRRKTC